MDLKVNIPAEVRREIEEFTAEVERRNRGEVDENDFKRFRLQQGIYGQRQAGDVQMVRTKLPLGHITSEKLNTLADSAIGTQMEFFISQPVKTFNFIT